jgi:hypothetical protein
MLKEALASREPPLSLTIVRYAKDKTPRTLWKTAMVKIASCVYVYTPDPT